MQVLLSVETEETQLGSLGDQVSSYLYYTGYAEPSTLRLPRTHLLYATSARKNLDSDLERFLEIMEMSRVFMKGKYINRHRESTIDIEDNDPRANLVDLVKKPESPDENHDEGTT